MAELADAFVALPGGFGTLDELLEQLTWSQLGLHASPIGLLDVEGYWRPLIALARHATEEGFVRESDLAAIAVADDPTALLDRLEGMRGAPRPRAKWTNCPSREERRARTSASSSSTPRSRGGAARRTASAPAGPREFGGLRADRRHPLTLETDDDRVVPGRRGSSRARRSGAARGRSRSRGSGRAPPRRRHLRRAPAPSRPWPRADVDGQRLATARAGSRATPNTSANASAATGRTSSTATGRPSSRAIDVKA